MSKLIQIIVTLCVLICFLTFYYFAPYLTITLILLLVLTYLCIDYKSQQNHSGRVRIHAELISSFLSSYWIILSNKLDKYSIVNLYSKYFRKTKSDNMPSVGPYPVNLQRPSVKPSTSYIANPNLNLDENRHTSRFRSTNFATPRNLDVFNSLSPIRRDSFNASGEFKNLRIGDLTSPQRTPNRSNFGILSDSMTMKHSQSGSSPRNVQTFAGPLLASTRYNLSSDSALFADANSSGLSFRVAKYRNDSPSITHQPQYSSPGQFPIVNLGKTAKLPVLSSRNSQKVSGAPMRIKMAPLESDERRSYSLSDRSRILSDYSQSESSKSVLDTLHEISRKRLHAQLGETDEEAAKKQRKEDSSRSMLEESTDEMLKQKRGREDSPVEEDQQKKRTKNNEILSSLSSSRKIVINETRPSKRKTSFGDWPNVSSTTPVGKMLKKSVASPDKIAETSMDHAESIAEDIPQKSIADSLKLLTPSLIAGLPKQQLVEDVVDNSPQRKVFSKEESGDWVRRGFIKPSGKLNLADMKDQRDQETKNKLLLMMSAIGGKSTDETDSSPSLSSSIKTSLSLPSFTSTPTATNLTMTSSASQLPTMFQAKVNSTEKHVHFAENLVQTKIIETVDKSDAITTSIVTQPTVGTATIAKENKVASDTLISKEKTNGFAFDGGFKLPTNTPLDGLPVLLGFPSASSDSAKLVQDNQDSVTNFGASILKNVATSPGSEIKKSVSFILPSASVVQEPSKPVGFTFGATSSATTPAIGFTIPTLPNLSFEKPGLSASLNSTITASSVNSSFGQIASPSFGTTVSQTSSPIMSTSLGQSIPSTFGKLATDLAKSTSQTVMFGQTTDSLKATSTSNVPGATFSLSTTFPTNTTSSPFAQTTTPSFGQSTFSEASKPTFGLGTFGAQNTTTTPASTLPPPPAYSSTKPHEIISPANGSVSKTEVPSLFAFGSGTTTSQNQPIGFGGFGASQNPPAFGSNTNQLTSQTNTFAFSSGTADSTTQATSNNLFGAKPITSSPSAFGSTDKQPAFQFNSTSSSTSLAAGSSQGGFKFDTQPAKPIPSLFGGFPSTSSATGSTVPSTTTTSNAFAFGSTAPPKPFAFGDTSSKPITPSTNMFGATTTTSSAITSIQSPSSGFGQNLFGSTQQTGVNASNLTQVPVQKPGALFGFGSSNAPQSNTFAFGSSSNPAKTGGFAFKAPQAQESKGGFNFCSTSAQPSSSFGQTAAQPIATFGQTAQPAPSFGQSGTQPAPAFGQSVQSTPAFGQTGAQTTPTFGQTGQPTSAFGLAAQSTPTFGQTGTQPTPAFGQSGAQSTPTFGQTVQPSSAFGLAAQSTPTFGQTVQPNSAFGQTVQSTPTFGQTGQPTPTFGQPALPTQTAGTFKFGQSSGTTSSGGFNFGGSSASQQPSVSFGGAPNNAFQMPGTVAPFGASPAQPGGMFSIGTGSASRGRLSRQSRRR